MATAFHTSCIKMQSNFTRLLLGSPTALRCFLLGVHTREHEAPTARITSGGCRVPVTAISSS